MLVIAMKWRRFLPLLLLGALAACGTSRPPAPRLIGRSDAVPGLSCVPFARELSVLAIYGDAYQWWARAAGRFARGHRPALGAVLVFRARPRMPLGHVSVVTGMVAPRQILVTQANWVSGQLGRDQLVVDISPRNDWSRVRVWWPPTGTLGITDYATDGFILPPRPVSRTELARAIPYAVRYGLNDSGLARPRALAQVRFASK